MHILFQLNNKASFSLKLKSNLINKKMSIANKADQIQDNNFISEYAKLPEV